MILTAMLMMFAAGIFGDLMYLTLMTRWKIGQIMETHVAGDASAVTDNSTGVASIGYKSKIMPIKTSRSDDFRRPKRLPLYCIRLRRN